MIVSSFFRMRSFRKDKASLTLKLCLPFFRAESELEEDGCKRLNAFYSSLAEAYRDSLTALLPRLCGACTVSVGFTASDNVRVGCLKRRSYKRKRLLLIERRIRSSGSLLLTDATLADIIDQERGILLK